MAGEKGYNMIYPCDLSPTGECPYAFKECSQCSGSPEESPVVGWYEHDKFPIIHATHAATTIEKAMKRIGFEPESEAGNG